MYVTGRTEDSKIKNGGTGLPTFIKNVMSKCSASFCYLMTGNKFIFFNDEFMKVNEDGTIGFNTENDFKGSPPDVKTLKLRGDTEYDLWYNFNGICYNLNFIKEIGGNLNE